MSETRRNELMGFGYTVATGRLFCSLDTLYAESALLLGYPVMTHEFGDTEVWQALRDNLEAELADAQQPMSEESGE